MYDIVYYIIKHLISRSCWNMLLSLIVLSPYMMWTVWTVQQVGAAGETTIFGSKYLIKNPQQDFPNGTGNAQGN